MYINVYLFLVHRIQDDTGVIINTTESNNNSTIIHIKGQKTGVELAKTVR